MSDSSSATPLSSHTLDSICVELLSGRAVRLDDGTDFQLNSSETRAAFDWYNTNRSKWTRAAIGKEDVEAVAERVALPPPQAAPARAVGCGAVGRKLHLKTVRAHRFAGLHRFGTVDDPPPIFVHTFDKRFSLIEGDNGAGKTSLLNAIVWCLTGVIYRSQRPPEPANQAVPLAAEGDATLAEGVRHVMSPITPLPPREVLAALGDQPLPLDTWVELTFEDEAGAEVGTVRRKVHRGANNSVVVKEPDFAGLGVSEIARLVGTKMPGLIPHILLGGTSELGKAVAELFGIKPLQDLARHATRTQEKLRGTHRKERETEIRKCDEALAAAAAAVKAVVADHPDIDPGCPLPENGADGAELTIDAVKRNFELRLNALMAGAAAYLGSEFDYNTTRQDLLNQVGPAIGAIEATAVTKLKSMVRLKNLELLTPAVLLDSEQLVSRLINEASELSHLASQPDLAARVRLYARVGGWLKEVTGSEQGVGECPICQEVLHGKVDTVTGSAVTAHLLEHLSADKGYLEKTPGAWGEHAMGVLRAELPEALQAEIRREPVAHPGDLLVEALGGELFAAPCFSGCLARLRSETDDLCRLQRASLPVYVRPAATTLPPGFAGETGGIGEALMRVSAAVAAAKWLHENHESCARMVRRVRRPSVFPFSDN